MLAATAALFLSTLGACNAAATSVLPLDLDQITAGAQHIVHVRCTNNEVQADAAIGAVTVTTFVVLDRAKGSGSPTFTVRQAGGELNGIAVDYHVPKFIVGNVCAVHAAGIETGLGPPLSRAFSVVQGTR
jgi:hypothetical protein